MIVRISTEGQYRLPDGDADRLNDLDNEAVSAVEAGDEERFHEVFERLLEFVRSDGSPLGDEEVTHLGKPRRVRPATERSRKRTEVERRHPMYPPKAREAGSNARRS